MSTPASGSLFSKSMTVHYWKRIWTQQEFLLAHNLEFHAPTGTLAARPLVQFDVLAFTTSAAKLMSANVGISTDTSFSPHNSYGSPLFGTLYNGFQAGRGQERNLPRQELHTCDLLALSLGSQDLQSSEPRDRVCGVMGLARDCDETDIGSTYEISLLETYEKVMRHRVQKHGRLDFLCFTTKKPISSYGDVERRFPSWLPSPEKQSEINRFATGLCQASGLLLARPDTIAINQGTLSLPGVQCDGIVSSTLSGLDHQPIAIWTRELETMSRRLGHPGWTRNPAILGILSGLLLELPDSGIGPLTSEKLEDIAALHVQMHSESIKLIDLSFNTNIAEWPGLSEAILSLTRMLSVVLNLAVCVETQQQRIGLCYTCEPTGRPEEGDEVWVFPGCPTPMVLRPKELGELSGQYFSVVGHVVMPGLIEGEAVQGLHPDGTPGNQYRGSLPEIINLI